MASGDEPILNSYEIQAQFETDFFPIWILIPSILKPSVDLLLKHKTSCYPVITWRSIRIHVNRS